MKIFIHNLGCDKNKVDGEKLAAKLYNSGFKITQGSDDADLVIVNTCGFIRAAKEESLETIFHHLKERKVAVAGCLAKRYSSDLKLDIPEADAILGLADSDAVVDKILDLYGAKQKNKSCSTIRLLSGLKHTTSLKISEGCNNLCSYCAIPSIRGKHVSRLENEILSEARQLREQGVKELIIVAQDTTAYGNRTGLPNLLKKLGRMKNPFEWIRLMYCHPSGISEELIDTIADTPSIVKYMDMPLQHISDPMLRNMNRHYTRAMVEKLIRMIRDKIPTIALRTTFITGFPGETEAQHQELCDFVKDAVFDRMGVFSYSPEEGTHAFAIKGRVPEKTMKSRMEELLYLQNDIINKKNQAVVNTFQDVLIDETEDNISIGRTERDAPDVDCNVIINDSSLMPGTFKRVKIKSAIGLDIYTD